MTCRKKPKKQTLKLQYDGSFFRSPFLVTVQSQLAAVLDNTHTHSWNVHAVALSNSLFERALWFTYNTIGTQVAELNHIRK